MGWNDPKWDYEDRKKFAAEWSDLTKKPFARITEFNPGWRKLVEEALSKIRALDEPSFILYQVKEKLGGLRIYGSAKEQGEKIEEIIREAEKLAATTCENCGATDQITVRCPQPDGGYIQGLCPACHKQRDKDWVEVQEERKRFRERYEREQAAKKAAARAAEESGDGPSSV